MNQSVITNDTQAIIVEKLAGVLDRKLTAMEEAMVEYTLTQVRFGLVELGLAEVK
jgi:hypothetical protein